MFEVRKFTEEMAHYEVLYTGYLLPAAEFLKTLSPEMRKYCFLAYIGDGTDGV